ncbi:MAG: GNAT family N-acetyltransferase [Phycisphaerae bacterium]|nr:GNAT family N-acetyltransferase [Phycisphaerae bacterium]
MPGANPAVEFVAASDRSRVLRLILAQRDGTPADARQIRRFEAMLHESGAEWRAAVALDSGQVRGAALVVLQPGDAALVMLAPATADRIEPAAQAAALTGVCDAAIAAGARLMQALPAPDDAATLTLMDGAGFERLTTLRYLERDARFPWLDAPPANLGTWLTYCDEHHATFVRALEDSYRESLDCPELNRARGAEDALRTHRAAGRFDPLRWNVLLRDDEPAAVLLLAALSDGSAAEITYLGVCPAHRRRGLGEVLVRQALALTRRAGLARLVLAVDARNTPASALYSRCGFMQYGERVACCRFVTQERGARVDA